MDETARPGLDWRELADAVPGGVAVQDGMAFVHASAEFAAIAGVDADAVVGERWWTFFDAVEAGRLAGEAFGRARSDGRWRGTTRFSRDAVAEDVPVEVTLSTTEDDRVIWVVSERRSIESEDADVDSGSRSWRDARFASQPDLLRAVLDTVDDVVYVIDDDGQLFLWNEALVERTGYTHEELEAMHPMRLVPEDQREFVPGLNEDVDEIESRRVDVDLRTKDGDCITHEFEAATYQDASSGEHYRVGIAREVTEEREREAELKRQRTLIQGILNTIPDVVFAFDEAGDPIIREAMFDSFLGYGADELAEKGPLVAVPDEDRSVLLERIRRVLVDGETVRHESDLVAKSGERVPHEFRAAPLELDGETLGVVGSARDVAEQRERELELQRRRDDLASLEGINELLLETVQELVQTASRDAVERIICERLTASELYEFAWVGERAFDSDRLVARSSAGAGGDFLDAVTVCAADDDGGAGPEGVAFDTAALTVTEVDAESSAPWHVAASERGFEAAAAVPLRRGDTVYGVLTVYATRSNAFSAPERAGLDVLGRTIGSVIHGARSRELLFADTIVELEFDISGSDSPLVDAAGTLECALSVDGFVASGDDWIVYLDVEGATADDVVDVALEKDQVAKARVIDEADGDGRVEVVLSRLSLLHTVTAAGATVQSAVAGPDAAVLVVEAPADADIRDLVDRVQAEYPEATLQARRECDREVTTATRPGGVLDELTTRQRDVVEAAYRAGYFAWPRESTAEEVADALGLAGATLHGHLRKAEQRLLARLLDDDSGSGGR